MSLRDHMLADADLVLSDLPAEDALYLPAVGAARLIRVVVDREGEEVNAEPRSRRRPVVVHAKNATTGGIAGAELTDRDCLRLAKDKGGEQVVMRIRRLRDETPGWIALEVE